MNTINTQCNRVYVEELVTDNMIDLPIPYGLSRVISLPRLNSNRQYILITMMTKKGVITLTCVRRMQFLMYGSNR
jgi:hypothetical protein